MTELEKILEESTEIREVNEVYEEREALAVLAALGTIKDYIGKNMTLGDVHRLSKRDVKKYYGIYQTVNGQQVYNTMVKGSLGIISKVLSRIIPMDSQVKLEEELSDNKLLQKELSSFAGYLVIKGGRLVALASGLLIVAKHVDFNKIQKDLEAKRIENSEPTDCPQEPACSH